MVWVILVIVLIQQGIIIWRYNKKVKKLKNQVSCLSALNIESNQSEMINILKEIIKELRQTLFDIKSLYLDSIAETKEVKKIELNKELHRIICNIKEIPYND